MNELKNCPFHNCLTCGCYDCVDIPDKQWNTRPIEDALQAYIKNLEEMYRESIRYISDEDNEIETLQARIPQWISVKDRLPEDGTRVMAYVNGWHEVAWHRKSIREWQFRDEIAFNNETNTYGLVTHWMPLPEPPKENE